MPRAAIRPRSLRVQPVPVCRMPLTEGELPASMLGGSGVAEFEGVCFYSWTCRGADVASTAAFGIGFRHWWRYTDTVSLPSDCPEFG
ncbi:hypothetical protein F4553_001439 [Allocatelliglobosispora scoriae]|uniref:Uncharacterized protein n=1 Tax=Allocatelliglobosispora scoriae TaxID=643052 RepID=A0A841BML1_9ACTN|nr:hypothetical protein [Allocatelliglobosispora scoriae]